MTIPISRLKKRWMKESGFKEGYDALEEEFSIAAMLIDARKTANLSQHELAVRMGTSQSTIARLEGASSKPSLATLARFAKATGMRVQLSFVPAKATSKRSPRKAA